MTGFVWIYRMTYHTHKIDFFLFINIIINNKQMNNSEQNILDEINTTAEAFLEAVKILKIKKAEIAKKIDEDINSNYFTEKSKVYRWFNEICNALELGNLIIATEHLIDTIEEEKDKMCECHEYIADVIDIGFEDSQTIYYCKFCLVTPKGTRRSI